MKNSEAKKILIDYTFSDFDLDILGSKYFDNWNEMDSRKRLISVRELLVEAIKRACLCLDD